MQEAWVVWWWAVLKSRCAKSGLQPLPVRLQIQDLHQSMPNPLPPTWHPLSTQPRQNTTDRRVGYRSAPVATKIVLFARQHAHAVRGIVRTVEP